MREIKCAIQAICDSDSCDSCDICDSLAGSAAARAPRRATDALLRISAGRDRSFRSNVTADFGAS